MHLLIRFLFGGAVIRGFIPDVGLLIGRLGFGLMLAFGHGLGKLPVSEGMVGMVGELGFPFPFLFAWAAALAEFVGAILVALGFFTRPAALAVAFTMIVAAFMKHATDPLDVKELALAYMFFALIFLFTGAGKISVDRLINRNWPQ